MNQSNFFSLGWRDFLRGFVMAILTPVFATVYASLEKGELTFNWHLIALSAVCGGMAYLSKNFFTKPDVSANDLGGSNPPIKDPKDK